MRRARAGPGRKAGVAKKGRKNTFFLDAIRRTAYKYSGTWLVRTEKASFTSRFAPPDARHQEGIARYDVVSPLARSPDRVALVLRRVALGPIVEYKGYGVGSHGERT